MHLPIAIGRPGVVRSLQPVQLRTERGSLRPEDFDATTNYAVQVPQKARQPAEQWLLSSRPLTHSVVHVMILVSEEGVLPSLLDYGLGDCPTAPMSLHIQMPLPGEHHPTSLSI